MYILNSNFSINPKIGPLSEGKINALKTLFGNKFPVFERPNENIVIFKRGLDGLFVAPEQITYITQGNSSEVNIPEIVESLKQAAELLEVSSRSAASIKFEANEDKLEDIMAKSKELVNEASEILGAIGVGFRFIINQEQFNGDVKIEPFIRDHQKLFYEVTLETNKVIDHSELTDIFNTMFEFGSNQAKKAADTLTT